MKLILIRKIMIALIVIISITSAFGKAKPNIIFVLCDDMGWKDLGCFGAELYETPNIDALCNSGIKFTHAYTSQAICSPTRASVMTGKTPIELGMWSHLNNVPKTEKVLASYLQEAGYQTWHVGKWHVGCPEDKTMPTDMGFDVNIGGDISWGPGSYFWPYGVDTITGKPAKHHRTFVPGLYKKGGPGEYLSERLGEEAAQLIRERDPEKPFYMNLWHYAVHNRKQAKPELVAKYKKKIKDLGIKETYRIDPVTGAKLLTSETNAVYAGMLESVDVSVGSIIEALKSEGILENTLIMFYSDNGPTVENVPCAPLRGGKHAQYEGGIRMPAFAAWAGKIKEGEVYEHPVYILDVFYTALELADVQRPEGLLASPGKSWLSVFEGEPIPSRRFKWYHPSYTPIRSHRANAAIFDQESGLKYMLYFAGGEEGDEVFNVYEDIAENHNIKGNNPEIEEELKNELINYLKDNYDHMAKTRDKKIQTNVDRRLGITN